MKQQIPSFSCLTQQTDKKINNPRTNTTKIKRETKQKKDQSFPLKGTTEAINHCI
jgi:hypothetical protein